MSRPIRRLAYGLALLASLALTLWAAAWGWSGALGAAVDARLAGWDRTGQATRADEWALARARSLTRARLDPVNADVALQLARLHEWRAWQQRVSRRDARRQRTLADDHYREALERRPSWGRAWAMRALNRARLDAESPDAHEALVRALEADRFLPPTQIPAVTAGLVAWEHLPDELRRELAVIVASMRRDWNTMQALRHAARTVERLALLEEIAQRAQAGSAGHTSSAVAPAEPQ